MKAALDLLELQTEAPRRVAVLGSMLELGEQSQELHDDMLRYAFARKLDHRYSFGFLTIFARTGLSSMYR